MKIIFLLLLLPSIALAKPYTVNTHLLQIDGTYAVTSDEARNVFEYTKARLKGVKVNLELKSHQLLSGICPEPVPSADYGEQQFMLYLCYETYINSIGKKGEYYYVLLPPALDELGHTLLGGFGEICQNPKYPMFTTGNAVAVRVPTGEDRIPVSNIVSLHESGHAFGSKHDKSDSRTVMNSLIGHLMVKDLYSPVPWSKRSRREIKNCTRWQKRVSARRK